MTLKQRLEEGEESGVDIGGARGVLHSERTWNEKALKQVIGIHTPQVAVNQQIR